MPTGSQHASTTPYRSPTTSTQHCKATQHTTTTTSCPPVHPIPSTPLISGSRSWQAVQSFKSDAAEFLRNFKNAKTAWLMHTMAIPAHHTVTPSLWWSCGLPRCRHPSTSTPPNRRQRHRVSREAHPDLHDCIHYPVSMTIGYNSVPSTVGKTTRHTAGLLSTRMRFTPSATRLLE